MENSQTIPNAVTVKVFQPQYRLEWDEFIETSQNATFLFKRNFMEYHQDRFEDFSLMIYKNKKLFGLLPAHRRADVFFSHQGLTYGALLLKRLNTTNVELVLNAVLDFLREQNFSAFHLKIMPQFLQQQYHSALEYFMFQKGARLVRRDMNFIINLSIPLKLSNSKRIKPNSETANSLTLEISEDLKTFWQTMLVPGLESAHGVKPVHSLAEIQLLKNRFPKNILLYYAFFDGMPVAGMLLFVDRGVLKSQYVSATERGKSLRALEFLYVNLLIKYQNDGFRFFDLGITNTDEGTQYNRGLTKYKEEFGAYAVNMDHFKLEL